MVHKGYVASLGFKYSTKACHQAYYLRLTTTELDARVPNYSTCLYQQKTHLQPKDKVQVGEGYSIDSCFE